MSVFAVTVDCGCKPIERLFLVLFLPKSLLLPLLVHIPFDHAIKAGKFVYCDLICASILHLIHLDVFWRTGLIKDATVAIDLDPVCDDSSTLLLLHDLVALALFSCILSLLESQSKLKLAIR